MVPVELRELVMQTFHASGHPNYKETSRRISEFYYWPKLKTNVEKYVKSCHPCQSTTPNRIKPPLGAFPLPDKRFQDLHLEVVGPLPESRGFKYIPSILCRSSCHYKAIPMVNATSEECCHAFLHGWVQRYGLPRSACLDKGGSLVAASGKPSRKP